MGMKRNIINLAEVCVFDEVVDGFGTKRLVLYKGFFPQAVETWLQIIT